MCGEEKGIIKEIEGGWFRNRGEKFRKQIVVYEQIFIVGEIVVIRKGVQENKIKKDEYRFFLYL